MKYWITLGITGRIAGDARRDADLSGSTGIGVWGNNRPIGWAWDITNFVFWIGIGHAGTLISAILFLFRQKWRTSINRSAEAMTLVRRDLRGYLSVVPHGASVASVLAVPGPQYRSEHVAEFPQSADLGRVRGIDVWNGFAVVLVHRLGSRSGDAARSRDHESPAVGFRLPEPRLARFGAALAHYEAAYLILAGISTPLVLSASTPSLASTSRPP